MYLEVKNLIKSYGRDQSYIQVLKGVNTSVGKGQMCVIQGTSGSGKSTLLNCIGGLAAIPLAKFIIDLIYPMFVANVACCMSISYDWYINVALYCTMMLVYLLINKLLMRKISKITPAQVLKNRE